MKKFIAFLLVLTWILCMGGCKETMETESTEPSFTEGILDGGADIAVDAETNHNQTAQDDNSDVLHGVLDGGADITLDATP